jgi:hypothetical protein
VGELLKVLGMTANVTIRTVHRPGEKVGGFPVDNRWTTVDNDVGGAGLWTGTRVDPLVLHSDHTGG